jgi:hypothetical protein
MPYISTLSGGSIALESWLNDHLIDLLDGKLVRGQQRKRSDEAAVEDALGTFYKASQSVSYQYDVIGERIRRVGNLICYELVRTTGHTGRGGI